MSEIFNPPQDGDVYEYDSLNKKGKWLTFQKLNKPFLSEDGTQVSLVGSKGDYTYKVGETIYKSKFRDNEAYVSNSISSKIIRDALKISFEPYWCEEDEVYSSGLRGIYPISNKTDGDEDWSIMNYFDTKKEINKILQNLWENDDGTDVLAWLVDKFSNDTTLVESLVERQWSSISNGFKLELDVVNILTDKFNLTEVQLYPPGSKIDRYGGVDLTVNGFNYQIKPGIKTTKIDNGVQVNTYGMKDYQDKGELDYIMYVKNTDLILFPNHNYSVIDSKTVIHYEPPIVNAIPR